MLNQVVLVGRVADDLKITKTEDGKDTMKLLLGVQRCSKNAEGIYETDFITCVLWNSIATNVNEYCKKGDIVGIKGRLQTAKVENDDGTFSYKQEVIAEKVTFLSSKSEKEKEQ